MAPSRRRGPSGKTAATAAQSAAILATERRRQEENEINLSCVNDSNKSDKNHVEDKTSTVKGVDVGCDVCTNLDPTRNNTTSIDAHAEVGKKRNKISVFPPFATDFGTVTAQSNGNSSSSRTQGVVIASTNQLLHSQPSCKIVPEDQQHHTGICSQQSLHGGMIYKRKQKSYNSKGGDTVDDDDDDDEEEDEGCLHCHEKVKNIPRIRPIDDNDGGIDNDSNEGYSKDYNIQVRCDDCGGYVCKGCHWCHEFQANHEIRVCDRCDAFYCRGCDEMDQCDDCGEVVCGSCSTLLSCKFCGGGLCEECATACGRCGIVLCSRDAKFAVDCDTCRLSYCLVCLASGSKDPCVRCGHRPSKRMEQLVHLRLKSIYKAFKKSNSNNCVGWSSSGGDGGNHYHGCDTTNSHGNSKDNDYYSHNSNKTRNGHNDRSRRKKPTTLQDMVGEYDDEDSGVDPAISMVMGTAAGVLPEKFCHDLQQNYLAEQQKADAAAEALLAELEKEETAMAQKKSKKKKKKERRNAAKQSAAKNNAIEDDCKVDEGDAKKLEEIPRVNAALLDSRDDEVNADSISETDSSDLATKVDDTVVHKPQIAVEVKTDPVEKELVECVNNIDLEGIEDILFRLKGVPGKAALRKNAKKALKRLKLELNPSPRTSPESKAEVPIKTGRKSTAVGKRSSSMLDKVVPDAVDSRISSKKTTIKTSTYLEKSTMNGTKTSHQKPSSQKNNASNRCEAVVEIVSRLVGWMIGKNGQRIRDLMEESGAKIWIDQEKFRGQETRNVYISGDRKAVDEAVLLVNDVIINAPPPQGTTNTIATATASLANMVSGKTSDLLKPSTTLPAQVATSGTDEVRSAWAKTPGNRTGRNMVSSRTIAKAPTFISSSVPVTVEKVKKRSKAKLDSETKIRRAFNDKEAPLVLLDDPKTTDTTTSPAIDASPTPSRQNKSTEVTTEIVTCDFRFVPLLIGKRGWAIKNIQDNSGARVDIDQTVTPRQVRISGSKENVDKAVTMVRDVLSYPHAQLQCSVEGVANDRRDVLPELEHTIEVAEAPIPVSPPTNVKLLADSTFLDYDVIKKSIPGQEEINDRINSPPPLVGDAKSAISASSSLSSTPEPSLASSSKGFIPSRLQNRLSIPQPGEHYPVGNTTSQAVSRQFLQSEADPIEGIDARGPWTSLGMGPRIANTPHPSYGDGSGRGNFQGGGPIAMSNGSPSHTHAHQLQQQGQHIQMNTPIMHEQQHSPGNPNHHPHEIQQSFVPAAQMSPEILLQRNTYGCPIDGNARFHNRNLANNHAKNFNMQSSVCGGPLYNLHSNEAVPAAGTIATTPLPELMHHGGVDSGPGVSSPKRTSGFAESDCWLWTSRVHSSSGFSSQQPRSSLGFAAASSGFTPGQSTETTNNNSFMYTNSQLIPPQKTLQNVDKLPTTTHFSGSIPSEVRNNDSQIIDNLFGGSTYARSSNTNATNELLSGFNTLSLNSDGIGAKESELWGSSNLNGTWNQSNERMVNGKDPAIPSIDDMFSSDNPNPFHGHPQESRFNWD